MNIILSNCRSTPFASYLKPLGIMRILSEQKKREIRVRGFWKDETFVLETNLKKEEIMDFFLNRYEPTPIVSPWNNGSGFYSNKKKGSDSFTGKELWNYLLESEDPRFKLYKETVKKIMEWPEIKEWKAEKFKKRNDEKKKKSNEGLPRDLKISIIRKSRNTLDDKVVKWIDASVVLDAHDEMKMTPLMSMGGSEGNLDYSSIYIKSIYEIFFEGNSQNLVKEWLENSVFGGPAHDLPTTVKIGKFFAGKAGGSNQGFGPEQKDIPTNPWDFIFLIEGSLLWNSGTVMHYSNRETSLFTPFTSGSIGGKYSVWTPVWETPSSNDEIQWLFSEGRSELKLNKARSNLEFLEATANLGVDRSIKKFIKYEIKEERGKRYYLMRQASSVNVKRMRNIDSIFELNRFISNVDRFISKFKKNPPKSLKTARSTLSKSVEELIINENMDRYLKVLIDIGKIMQIKTRLEIQSREGGKRYINVLGPKWLEIAYDGSPEFRIAAAIASISSACGADDIITNIGVNGNDNYSWKGNSLYDKMINTLSRRIIEAHKNQCKENPLKSKLFANVEDVSAFITGNVDNQKIENIIYGLMVVDWDYVNSNIIDSWRLSEKIWFVPHYPILKLLFSPRGKLSINGKEIIIKTEDSVIPMIKSGRVSGACEIARRRLLSSGLSVPKIRYENIENPERLAASLLIPVDMRYIIRYFESF